MPRAHLLLRSDLAETEHWEAPWPPALGSSSSHYGTRNSDPILPTRSRLREELVLQTYRSGNEPLEASDREAARELYNGGGGIFRRCSGGGGGAGRGSSSKRRISAGGLGDAD
jgi:hypothetical protein